MWAQLLLGFSTDHFKTMHTCFTWSVNIDVVLGLSSRYFLSTFVTFSTMFFFFFSGPICIRIDILWAQLLLDFSTDHLESIQTCFTWSEDVHVVLSYPAIIFLQFFALFQFSFFSCDTMTWVACGCNFSYCFRPYFLKFRRCFCHGLKMCMCF